MTITNKYFREAVMMAIDAILICASFVLALHLAMKDIADINYRWFEYLWMISVVVAVKLYIFAQTGLYNEIIRYVSIEFAIKIIKATVFASLISITLLYLVRREIEMPVLVVDWMASCILIGASRFGLRYVQEGRFSKSSGRNTLLYGAGEHGAAVARHLMLNANLGHKIIGFIDDSENKKDKQVQGIPVLGGLESMAEVIRDRSVDDVVVSFANPDGDLMKRVFTVCKQHGVRCRIVPGMADVIQNNDFVRNVDIADLLRRPQRTLDKNMIAGFLKGRRVMITGAAGSIGSEIFRQILGYEPQALAALDHSEYGLYQLDEECSSHPLKRICLFSLVDIKYPELVEAAISEFRPDVIFHAAAYKHVPILEQDVRQAVLNNVLGLQNVVESAKRNNVSRFVFISTDKAVRPTNVMGATKRIGELIIQVANSGGKMECLSVRFGNVLASSGSVVPKFIAQIKAGGPVTVTHPEITRYFMLIPEAVELVLQAASIGEGGELFVLDMGKPMRILEMAEDLISLMGHVPHSGIPIVFTGLRPGEKLHEELFMGEIERATKFRDINIGKVGLVHGAQFTKDLGQLLDLAKKDGNVDRLRESIKRIVPEFVENL